MLTSWGGETHDFDWVIEGRLAACSLVAANACYLVSEGMMPDQAIARVRAARPGSVQTEEQEQFVHRWAMVQSGKWRSGRFF